jgi:hypothetical protein
MIDLSKMEETLSMAGQTANTLEELIFSAKSDKKDYCHISCQLKSQRDLRTRSSQILAIGKQVSTQTDFEPEPDVKFKVKHILIFMTKDIKALQRPWNRWHNK